LRLAVVGYEELVTAEAGHRVGLSAGARVVHVAAGRLDRTGVTALKSDRPDIVLLVGGTDGGDVDVLRHNAKALTAVRVPVVVAGNSEVRDEALSVLGPSAIGAENVLPRIGELNPEPARAAIRTCSCATSSEASTSRADPASRPWCVGRRRTSCSPRSRSWPRSPAVT
jgi:uncharacterized protein (TIGR01319 family)